jgi:2-dehydropantoate 2-reductase
LNGIPWWYFERHGGPLDGTRLETVDPGGVIAGSIDSAQVVGAVVYPATRLAAPGVVEHVEGDRFSLGELDGGRSERSQEVAAALIRAGLRCPVRRDIRKELRLKPLGNVAFNPLGALTRATLASIAADEGTRDVALAMMREAEQVARAAGVTVDLTVEQRLEGAGRVGEHKTSMLQDVEAGRPVEVDALVGAVVEIGHLTGVPVPRLEMAWACVRLLDATLRASG